ncbi:hypothetical protein [Streptomyces sp. NPDC059489]|uniref:hypothetical protein n=1 Tax=Streptomyces sp. NPDC059489 TaxID=3346849 RepID=UPI0036CD16E5
MLALGVQGVAGNHRVGEVRDGAKQWLEAGDLDGFLADVELGQDQATGVVTGGEQVNLPTVGLSRAAQALAVHGQTTKPGIPGRLRTTICRPASDGSVARIGVDTGQQTANRRLGGQSTLGTPSSRSTCAGASAIHSPTISSEVAPDNTAHAASASTTASG